MLNRTIPLYAKAFVLILTGLALAGCGGKKPQLMPTPNVYTHPEFNPFADVPPPLQGNKIEVLYVTDRAPQKDKEGNEPSPQDMHYGKERSRSAAFGVAEFQIGDENLTWDQLVQQSRLAERDIKKLDLAVVGTRELGRFAPTPPSLVIFGQGPPPADVVQKMRAAEAETEKRFLDQLNAQLAKTPRKEVFLFIHGFNVDFPGSVLTIAELWHFLGREGVPMAYSWPAGQGVLRAYEYTNQSAMFTIFHLKQTLKLIASCPTVEKVHIIAHSRGTAVATDAVRELCLEIRGKGNLKDLKLGAAALCAADLDFDVVIEQNTANRVGETVDAIAIYVFKGDKALSFSNWLSGGTMRLGDVSTDIFNEEEIVALRNTTRLQLIDSRITKPGSFGHNYFHENPAVSSDLILYLRYNLPPGGKDGRPLGTSDTGFWIIDDDYPGAIDAPWFKALRQPPRTARVGE